MSNGEPHDSVLPVEHITISVQNSKDTLPHDDDDTEEQLSNKIANPYKKLNRTWSEGVKQNKNLSKFYVGIGESESKDTNINQHNILKTKDIDGFSLLHFAAYNGKYEKIPFLTRFIDVNDRDNIDCTPLHYATMNGSSETVTCLLRKGADINAIMKYGCSALHIALLTCLKLEIIAILIQNGIDVNATDECGQTAVHYLARPDLEKKDGFTRNVMKLLCEKNVNIDAFDQNGYTPLQEAIVSRSAKLAEELVKQKANFTLKNKFGQTALHIAVRYWDDTVDDHDDLMDPKVANILQALTAKVRDMKDNSNLDALHIAVVSGKLGFVKFLINQNANVFTKSSDDQTILHIATKNDDRKMLEYLIERLGRVKDFAAKLLWSEDCYGVTPLQYAICNGNIGAIRLIFKHRTDKNNPIQDRSNTTSYMDFFNVLLQYNVNLTAADRIVLEQAMANDYYKDQRLQIKRVFHILHTSDCPKINQFSVDVMELILDSCIKRDGDDVYVDYNAFIQSRDQSSEHELIDAVYFLSQSKHIEILLLHPAVKSFIRWKWRTIAPFYYLNLFSYLIICLTVEVLFIAEIYISLTFIVILSIFSVILTFKEIVQCYVNWKYYLMSIENYVEVGVIAVMLLMVIGLQPENFKQVAAAGHVLIGFSVTFLCGKHPKASTAVELLKTVTYQFFKYFSIYIFIILSFALSFHQLFYNAPETTSSMDYFPMDNETIDTNQTDNQINIFDYGFITLQTMIMVLGEFGVDNLTREQYSTVAICILILFFVFISIIMVNLLNGLAVSNILGKEELRISKHKIRVEYLYFANNSLKWVSKLSIFSNILKNLNSYVTKIYIYTKPMGRSKVKHACIYSQTLHHLAIAASTKRIKRIERLQYKKNNKLKIYDSIIKQDDKNNNRNLRTIYEDFQNESGDINNVQESLVKELNGPPEIIQKILLEVCSNNSEVTALRQAFEKENEELQNTHTKIVEMKEDIRILSSELSSIKLLLLQVLNDKKVSI